MVRKIILSLFLCSLAFAQDSEDNEGRALPAFPPDGSQQCEDDAGPRWIDDLEEFGADKFYWSDSHARAVLNQDGSCPPKLEAACQQRANPLQAFIEGPIACPDAWFCRIYPDPNHGAQTDFLGDRNFGDCDQPNSNLWEATNTDQDGHCHGGLDPSSYYWWIRDHWNRPYSGRVKCCCADSMQIEGTNRRTMDLRGIANRCDYRARVTVGADNCRDANEDHAGGRMGSGFLYGFDGPCPLSADGETVGPTREPADDMCWEILNFGLPDDNDNDDTIYPTSTGPCTGAGSATRGTCNGQGVFSGPNDGPYQPPNGVGVVTLPPYTPFTYPPEPTQGPGGNTPDGGSDSANGENGADSTDGGNDSANGENEADSADGGNDDSADDEVETSLVVQSITSTCPAGRDLTDADLCRLAAESLGLRYKRAIRRSDRPRGCYSKGRRAWFNKARSVDATQSSSNRLAICCSTDSCSLDEVDEDDSEDLPQDGELEYVQSSAGSCPEGTNYITEVDVCFEAAEALGLRVKKVFRNRNRVRGCYAFNGKAYFNRHNSFTSAETRRQSICTN